jgi:hypothetical protein
MAARAPRGWDSQGLFQADPNFSPVIPSHSKNKFGCFE